MKVTIYIPCYNAQRYIVPCLHSVLRQTYPPKEILVIDDCSQDRTVELASRFPVRVIRHSTNKGLASVRNTALKYAQGEFLASLDADCIPQHDWLEKLMKAFSPANAGVGGRVVESNNESTADAWRAIHMKQEWGQERVSSVQFLYGSNTVFRKDVLLGLGGYNEAYGSNYEDVDISHRIKKEGYGLSYEPEAIVNHIKKDTVCSLFDSFWNWNFNYHEKKGYYKDTEHFCLKLNENIGLANKFLEEDLRYKRFPLITLDFLLALSLVLKDFSFLLHGDNSQSKSQDLLMLYLQLIDLTFFYHLDIHSRQLRTLIPPAAQYSQHSLALLLLVGSMLREKIDDPEALKAILYYCIKIFSKREEIPAFFLDKLVLLIASHDDWSDFFKKDHVNLERQLLACFVERFGEWLNKLEQNIPNIFILFKLTVNQLIKKEAV